MGTEKFFSLVLLDTIMKKKYEKKKQDKNITMIRLRFEVRCVGKIETI